MQSALELVQVVRAPRDLIWQHCSTAEGLARWQADAADGSLRLGGRLRLGWPALGARLQLEVVERTELQSLTLRSGSSTLSLSVHEGYVTLRHEDASDADPSEGLRSSWISALAHLAHCVERHPGRARRVAWAIAEAQVSPELAHFYFTDDDALRCWLGTGAGIGPVSQPYSLTLFNRQVLEGQILANTRGRDVVVSCNNLRDSVLALRTLPSPGRPGKRILAAVWSEWGAADRRSLELQRELKKSLSQLKQILSNSGSC